MDWRSVNFSWNHARAFLVTAEEGSFTAAARALGTSQPTIGRQVTALEEELGVVLFERVGQGVALTPSGLGLIEHVRAMSEAANRVALSATGQAQTIEGPICLTAADLIAAHVVSPLIARLRRAQPGISVELVASNEASDLRRREADIAIRSFRPRDPELIAKKVRDVPGRLYGAKSYLEQLGRPSTASDLVKAEFIGYDKSDALMELYNAHGLTLTRANFSIISKSQFIHWELVRSGAGIGIMIEDIGDAEPLVERAIPDLPPIVSPLWLVAHRELKSSHRVRFVFDFLAEALKEQ